MQKRFYTKLAVCGLLVFIAVLSISIGSADAWWDGKWKYRKKIVLDTTAKGAEIKEAAADIPVLVRLHSGNFNFSNAKNDGADIRFVAADDKTALKYHIEKYDAKEEMVLVWVKVNRLAPNSNQDFMWLYYGNSGAADGQDRGGTYDTAQLVAYHLTEKDGTPMDATAYGNNGKEFTGKLGSPAAIGSGITLKGEGERLVIGKSPSLNIVKGFTFSAWVRMAGSQKDARLLSWDDGKQSVVIGVDGTKLYSTLSDQKGKPSSAKAVDLPTQKWVHVTVTAEPGKNLTIYTDGRERASQKLAGALPEPGADISIGASLQGKNSFAGDIDELQIAGSARPQAYVLVAAAAQGPETPFFSYLEEESSSGGGEANLTLHLMVVTMKAVTLDGWIIIGILVIMGAWCWIVFFNKFIILRKMAKSNAAFSESFIKSDDFRALKGRDEEFENSSLFQVYRSGMEELERRVEKMLAAGGSKFLPIHAITAFKAALDKASLQESKKNTSGLLILTLSVSGGPFLGLMGTVWGVINTFAGVAEAGEASLAAIAPGVASALACTLAGLLVAIPALFVYSYLSSVIKSSNADMNVFMGEFITLVEEEYGGKHE